MKEKSAKAEAPPQPAPGASTPGADFPWTWDQLQRYAVLAAFLDVFYPGRRPRLLDVGGVSPFRNGIGTWLPAMRIRPETTTVLDVVHHRESGFVQGDACRLPFQTGSFDVVSALDVVEHIPGDKREALVSEAFRVSRGSVVLAAPFRDSFIDEAERLLFDQIKTLYGVGHRQLLEHRELGLPEAAVVSGLLKSCAPEAPRIEFSYGSLRSWLYHQSIKNVFMFRPESDSVHEAMDRWMASRQDYWEAEPPFSRRFWISSRDIGRRKLGGGAARIMARLPMLRPAPPSFDDLACLNRMVTSFALKERVLAVVVTDGGSPCLAQCLAHLFTQVLDFDLEVVAWDLSGRGEGGPNEDSLLRKFPGLRFFSPRHGDNLAASLLEIGLRSAGRFIMLVADDILLPQNSASAFRNALASHPDHDLLIPKVLVREGADRPDADLVEFGGEEMTAEPFSPAYGRRTAETDRAAAGWVWSECLFFRREALAGRRLKKCPPSKKEVFLWEKERQDQKILFVPEHTVLKCPAP